MVTIGWRASTVLAIGGYPAITVLAGYESDGNQGTRSSSSLESGTSGTQVNVVPLNEK